MTAVDTNILIYSIDRHNPVKRAKARELLRQLTSTQPPAVLLWQVAGEFLRQLRAWQDQGQLTFPQLERYANSFRRLFPMLMPTPAVLDRALDVTGRYSLSHWDSMLIGACLEAHVDTLYTEDMGAPTTIDTVRLINPL